MRKIIFLLSLFSTLISMAQPGIIDTGFSAGTGPDNAVYAMVAQPDGKIIIGGAFSTINGVARKGIARLNADGSLDGSFDPGVGISTPTQYIFTMALQSDGEVIIGGAFTSFAGISRNRIARINTDGTLDTSFNPGTGFNSDVMTVNLQSDGKVIVGGFYTSFNSVTQNRIARLNTDGTLDSSFVIGTGFNSYVYTSCIQPDGKILVGGGFAAYKGGDRRYIARLLNDGTLDTTFGVSITANQSVLAMSLQPDGKILIGGYFTTYLGTSRNRIARINANGSLDTSFDPGTGINDYPTAIGVQQNGKILLGGAFATYNGTARSFFTRVNADGSLDNLFTQNGGTNAPVYAINFRQDGKVLLGGEFTTYNTDATRPFIARVEGYEANSIAIASLSAASPFCQNQALTVNYTAQGYYAAGNSFTAQLSDASGSFATPVNIGTLAATASGAISATIPALAPAGTGYRIRVVSSDLAFTGSDNGSNLTINGVQTYYEDVDADGYGNPAVSYTGCAQAGYVADGTDCDDTNPNVHPNHAEILYNGIDDDCDGAKDEGFQITSNVQPAQCGITLATLNSQINTVSLPNATRYRFSVTNLTMNVEQILERPLQFFTLTMLGTYDYATTYSVKVEIQRNGVWLGYYGNACLVSTPAILSPTGAAQITTQCGQTLPDISSLIYTTSLANISGYRFRVTNMSDPLAPNQEQILDRTLHWFSLPMLTTYNYGTTYKVEVAVRNNVGVYSNYGNACMVTSPAAPKLVPCGGTIANKSAKIYTSSMSKATAYRFMVTDLTTTTMYTIDKSLQWFTLADLPAYTPGGELEVRIAVMTSGSWSLPGDACTIIAPGVAKEEAPVKGSAFAVAVYPNPFASDFGIDVKTSSASAISIKVYDMTGRLIDMRTVPANEMETYRTGSNYPSGVYNAIIEQDENVRSLRIVKR